MRLSIQSAVQQLGEGGVSGVNDAALYRSILCLALAILVPALGIALFGFDKKVEMRPVKDSEDDDYDDYEYDERPAGRSRSRGNRRGGGTQVLDEADRRSTQRRGDADRARWSEADDVDEPDDTDRDRGAAPARRPRDGGRSGDEGSARRSRRRSWDDEEEDYTSDEDPRRPTRDDEILIRADRRLATTVAARATW